MNSSSRKCLMMFDLCVCIESILKCESVRKTNTNGLLTHQATSQSQLTNQRVFGLKEHAILGKRFPFRPAPTFVIAVSTIRTFECDTPRGRERETRVYLLSHVNPQPLLLVLQLRATCVILSFFIFLPILVPCMFVHKFARIM